MLFNSPEFAVFLVLVLGVYYSTPTRVQNVALLIASYVFYGWWDWRFLSLIALSTVVDYTIARALDKEEKESRRRALIATSIVANLTALGVFKYFNFFTASLVSLCSSFGINVHIPTLAIVLPVGISFYTFQTLSYSIDVFRREISSTRRFVDFALYVSFFPQLVAGPIERASHLLPILSSRREVTLGLVTRGGWLIYWGLFKKVVIADNLALVANPVFGGLEEACLLELLVATYCFAWQIYCDFSGYTDIARGCAALMGIELCLNFNLPYFAISPSDFWRRWHISLSTWLRDYLYVPLGGNRHGAFRMYRNLLLTMLLGGLWHGASWNFVAWGAFHGVILIIFRKIDLGRLLPHWLAVITFFHITCAGWLLFRVQDLSSIQRLGTEVGLADLSLPSGIWRVVFVLPLICLEIGQYRSGDPYCIFRLHWLFRGLVYACIYWCLFAFGQWGVNEFIYFQF